MIVLDTHIWHWWINQIPGKLSLEIITLIEETDEIAVSAISCFEMAWLVRHNRIDLDMPFEHWFSEVEKNTDIQILPVTAQIGIQAVALLEHHKDPQDRIIISTALLYDAQLLSFDTAFSAYRELDGRLIGRQ
jgi:PIN domain nuclease of toxin-antitoxin system